VAGLALAVAGLLGGATAPATARASEELFLPARDDASTLPRGHLSFGIWNPLRYALSDGVELQAHPLIFFVSPHLEAHVEHLRAGGWRLTGVYALSLPSPAMRLSQGYLFPAWKQGGGKIGWSLVPRVGLLASRYLRGDTALTLRADLAVGIPLVRGDARPLEAWAPLDLLFDPVVAGYRGRVGAIYDRPLSARWRWRVLADAYLHGIDRDHTSGFLTRVTFRVGAGIDLALGRRTRLVLGVYGWNDYQHAADDAGNPVRSNLLLPVIDLLWSI
jgi:hypothetical protein